jgi:hypothetical protein
MANAHTAISFGPFLAIGLIIHGWFSTILAMPLSRPQD